MASHREWEVSKVGAALPYRSTDFQRWASRSFGGCDRSRENDPREVDSASHRAASTGETAQQDHFDPKKPVGRAHESDEKRQNLSVEGPCGT